MTHPDFTCRCGRHVDVTRLIGGRAVLWHACDSGLSYGISADTEDRLHELWTAERQRRAA